MATSGDCALEIAIPVGESLHVSLVDNDGQVIAEATEHPIASPPNDLTPVFSKRLAVPSLPAGTYSLKLVGGSFGIPYELRTKNDSRAGDINRDHIIGGSDIDALFAAIARDETDAHFDLDDDGSVDQRDADYLIEVILDSSVGDDNLDGTFNSTDLVQIFQAGLYEGRSRNATRATGGWNGDLEFTTADLVTFHEGSYSHHAQKNTALNTVTNVTRRTNRESPTACYFP